MNKIKLILLNKIKNIITFIIYLDAIAYIAYIAYIYRPGDALYYVEYVMQC